MGKPFVFVLVALLLIMAVPHGGRTFAAPDAEHHFLYVAEPGIRNYVEHGGIGILVFDIDRGYTFVRRIPTQDVPAGSAPENVKGIAASAATGRVYVTTLTRIMAFELATDRKLWDRACPGGCDRLGVSPEGKSLYVPSLEGPPVHVMARPHDDRPLTAMTTHRGDNRHY